MEHSSKINKMKSWYIPQHGFTLKTVQNAEWKKLATWSHILHFILMKYSNETNL
jgi:hypothetical protein